MYLRREKERGKQVATGREAGMKNPGEGESRLPDIPTLFRTEKVRYEKLGEGRERYQDHTTDFRS